MIKKERVAPLLFLWSPNQTGRIITSPPEKATVNSKASNVVIGKHNDGSLWQCLSPTLSGAVCIVAIGWTILVPYPLAYVLWLMALYCFYYTVNAFVLVGK